jgi:hypothetical protein
MKNFGPDLLVVRLLHDVSPVRWYLLRPYRSSTGAVAVKPIGKFSWINYTVLVSRACDSVKLSTWERATLFMSRQADVVVHAVQVNEVQVRVAVGPAVDASMETAAPQHGHSR